MNDLILAIDQGTTSTRAIAFDTGFRPVAVSQIELRQHFPRSGWVEHDADEIWRAVLKTCREVIAQAGGVTRFSGIGLTNQRETAVVWEAASGRPLHRAIVWQDRRTAEAVAALKAKGHEPEVQAATGLILDPYFSASKYAWLLDAVPDGRKRAEGGELRLGTIDAWLIWNLTAGRTHATDATNAARTSLMELETQDWREDLCDLFGVPMSCLPDIAGCAETIAETEPSLFGRALPIAGSAGDQQAALVGHAALDPGDIKITFGTGAFLVANVGPKPVASTSRLLATLGYRIGDDVAYALEGSIFSAGATIQWLRDGLGLIGASRESEALAESLPDSGGVYLVPGFTGLGAPWWEAEARAAILGLSRGSGPAHIVRAGLESLAYQTRDLIDALVADGSPRPTRLKVDGGVTANGFAMQTVADLCQVEVERPAFQEMTALGAARLAAHGLGRPDAFAPLEGAPAVWSPRMDDRTREAALGGWRRAVRAAIAASSEER